VKIFSARNPLDRDMNPRENSEGFSVVKGSFIKRRGVLLSDCSGDERVQREGEEGGGRAFSIRRKRSDLVFRGGNGLVQGMSIFVNFGGKKGCRSS